MNSCKINKTVISNSINICYYLVPFVIDALHQGKVPNSFTGHENVDNVQNPGQTSSETGYLLATFAGALVISCLILGYIGIKITKRRKDQSIYLSIYLLLLLS